MDLHGIVSGKISRINANQSISVRLSQGYTTDAAGGRTPTYSAPITVVAQVQDLAQKDLRQLEGLSVQGSQRTLYVNGKLDGVVRFSQQGGDLITLQDATIWLTTAVLEQWPDWVKVSLTQQIR